MKKSLMGAFLTVLVSTVLMAGPAMAQRASEVPVPAVQAPLAAPNHPLPDLPDTYGTSAISYYMIPGISFFPWDSTHGYSSDNFGRGPRWPTSVYTDLNAVIHLPGGAKVIYMELDAIDNNASAQTFASLITCPWTGTGCTYHPVSAAQCQTGFICTTLAGASAGITLVSVDLTPDNLVVDNYNNQFTALAEPNAADGTEKVAGVIIGYKLQVSPAPGSATFGDVPTSHPFFRWIQALAASGITAGCGGGNFCPDQAVTRGQMAVYLATALGLQFP